MPRNRRTDDELVKDIDHVLYEFEMLVWTCGIAFYPGPASPLRNAVLESFLLHSRVAHEFFHKTVDSLKGHDLDNVTADDFFPGPSKSPLKGVDTALNKFLAHPDKMRSDGRRWHVDDFRELIETCGEFAAKLVADRRFDSVKQRSKSVVDAAAVLLEAFDVNPPVSSLGRSLVAPDIPPSPSASSCP
jgi:hypothetical protein